MSVRVMPNINIFTNCPTTEFAVSNEIKHFVVLHREDFDTRRASTWQTPYQDHHRHPFPGEHRTRRGAFEKRRHCNRS